MREDEKEILLNDLCARLPYGVKCSFGVDDAIYEVCGVNPTCCGASQIQATHVENGINGDFSLSCCKPYLYPLSSMTDEEKSLLWNAIEKDYETLCDNLDSTVIDIYKGRCYRGMPAHHELDYLNKNQFDWRGLIPMGLALDATGKGVYSR